MLKKILLATFLLTVGLQVGAQVTFQAKVSKNRMGINERLKVSFEMNKNGDNFTPPQFEGFRVVGGPNQSTSNSWINGKRSFSRSFTYFLNPTRKGKLSIGQATCCPKLRSKNKVTLLIGMVIKNKILRSKP